MSQQPELTLQQMVLKCVFETQNNLNKLIAMTEQQMLYINQLFNQVISTQGGNDSNVVSNNNNQFPGTESTNKNTNTQPIPP